LTRAEPDAKRVAGSIVTTSFLVFFSSFHSSPPFSFWGWRAIFKTRVQNPKMTMTIMVLRLKLFFCGGGFPRYDHNNNNDTQVTTERVVLRKETLDSLNLSFSIYESPSPE
jgi:hypothetical protein